MLRSELRSALVLSHDRVEYGEESEWRLVRPALDSSLVPRRNALESVASEELFLAVREHPEW